MPCYTGHTKDGGQFFMCGNLGPHCSYCGDVGTILCDYPVGNGKTCDRHICENHANEVADDIHYCHSHHQEWMEFIRNGGTDGLGAARVAAAVANAKELEAVVRMTASATDRYELLRAKEYAAKAIAKIGEVGGDG